jgi:hypothetical protein
MLVAVEPSSSGTSSALSFLEKPTRSILVHLLQDMGDKTSRGLGALEWKKKTAGD